MSNIESPARKVTSNETEQRWSSNKGEVSTLNLDKILLWNFDISSSSLKPEHIKKIREIISQWRDLVLKGEAIIRVIGYANDSRDESLNSKIALQRSKEVGSFLYTLGLGKEQVFLSRQDIEFSSPLNLFTNGIAENRSVEITLVKLNKNGLSETSKGVNEKQKSITKFQGKYDLNERVYTDKHPEGGVTKTGQTTFILWNYNISSSQLKPEHKKMLDEISKLIDKATKVLVEGHASKTGSELLNKNLSQARALEVVEYLTRHGVKEENIVVKAYGNSKPWYSDETSDGMARNRRVEIKVIAPGKPKPPIQPIVVEPIKKTEPGFKFPELLEIIPNMVYDFKYQGKLPKVYLKYLIIHPIIIYSGKLTIKTKSIASIEVSEDKIVEKIKVKLDNDKSIKINASEGKMSLKFEDVDMTPEFELNLMEIKDLSKPFSITLTPKKAIKFPLEPMPNVKVEVELNVQVKFEIEPNLKELIKDAEKAGKRVILSAAEKVAEYGVANAVYTTLTIAAIGASVYMVFKIPDMIQNAEDRKLSEYRALAYLDGYAARIAAEVSGPSSHDYMHNILHGKYFGQTSNNTLEDSQRGWSEAEQYVDKLKSMGKLDNFVKGIRNHHSNLGVIGLQNELYRKLYGMYDFKNNILPDVYSLCQ